MSDRWIIDRHYMGDGEKPHTCDYCKVKIISPRNEWWQLTPKLGLQNAAIMQGETLEEVKDHLKFCSSSCASRYGSEIVEPKIYGGGAGGSISGSGSGGYDSVDLGVAATVGAAKGIGWVFKGIFNLYKYIFIGLSYYFRMFWWSIKWLLGKGMERDSNKKKMVKRIGGAVFLLVNMLWFGLAIHESVQKDAFKDSGIYTVEAITQKSIAKGLVTVFNPGTVTLSGPLANYFTLSTDKNVIITADPKNYKVTVLMELQSNGNFEAARLAQENETIKSKGWNVEDCQSYINEYGTSMSIAGGGKVYKSYNTESKKNVETLLALGKGEKAIVAWSYVKDKTPNGVIRNYDFSKKANKELYAELSKLGSFNLDSAISYRISHRYINKHKAQQFEDFSFNIE